MIIIIWTNLPLFFIIMKPYNQQMVCIPKKKKRNEYYMSDNLEQKIIELKENLKDITEKYNFDFSHPVVVEISQRLDKILNEYMQSKNNNKESDKNK
jgi:hypothetical protein